MSRTPTTGTVTRALSSHPGVRDLFVPISAFLLRSGMTKAQLLSEWRVSIHQASRTTPGLKVVRIGSENLASSIISRWLRDPTYLNHAGRPADLPVHGKRSVASLLKAGKVTIPPTKVLALLLELGTVKKVASARYRLIRRSMNYTIPEYLPFEPNFRFLVDAARACTWGSGFPPKTKRLFWLNAITMRVHSRYAPEFLRFAKERGLSFIHEINDWLEAHESQASNAHRTAKGVAKVRRLGMGLFGISSDVA